MTAHTRDLDPPIRVLLGPGPSNVHPRVTRALSANVVGYLDPAWLATMAETVELLRAVYGTTNHLTIPLSGTGMSGMEGLFYNLLEPDDTIIIGVSGFFGDRMVEVASRAGANVVPIHAEWGTPFDPSQIADALAAAPEAKAVAIVHAETSTGVLQPVDEIGRIVRDHGALFILDCVTSLGGVAVDVDARWVDAAYSC
ncbi:MAG: aminotransferase class V-fold PLP-dependent enzyme, partial [Dehalococcoidia bacterium]|nr:aminotransferase class V-fold PLP-dependent enzyme [Dehalococcoidia bacterium]